MHLTTMQLQRMFKCAVQLTHVVHIQIASECVCFWMELVKNAHTHTHARARYLVFWRVITIASYKDDIEPHQNVCGTCGTAQCASPKPFELGSLRWATPYRIQNGGEIIEQKRNVFLRPHHVSNTHSIANTSNAYSCYHFSCCDECTEFFTHTLCALIQARRVILLPL